VVNKKNVVQSVKFDKCETVKRVRIVNKSAEIFDSRILLEIEYFFVK
jgi:hypothetical protein